MSNSSASKSQAPIRAPYRAREPDSQRRMRRSRTIPFGPCLCRGWISDLLLVNLCHFFSFLVKSSFWLAQWSFLLLDSFRFSRHLPFQIHQFKDPLVRSGTEQLMYCAMLGHVWSSLGTKDIILIVAWEWIPKSSPLVCGIPKWEIMTKALNKWSVAITKLPPSLSFNSHRLQW